MSSVLVAAELLAGKCLMLAARKRKDGHAWQLIAREVFALDADVSARLRQFRQEHKLPRKVRVVMWPRETGSGVTMIGRFPDDGVAGLSTLEVRERGRPLVRAGFRIASAALPHAALGMVALAHGATLAVAVALHDGAACFAFARGGQVEAGLSYVHWPAAGRTGDGDSLLERYQLAAALEPYLRRCLDAAPAGARVVACGSLPEVRAAVVPLIEACDLEIEVLDAGLPAADEGVAEMVGSDVVGWQTAWMTAIAPTGQERLVRKRRIVR